MVSRFLFILFLSAFMVSCSFDFEAGYTHTPTNPYKEKGKDTIEVIDLMPKDMFYIRLQEYFDTVAYQTEDNGVVSHNEANVRLYRSVRKPDSIKDEDFLKKTENIVEEKYLYLEDYDSNKGGRVVLFKTVKYIENQAVRNLYSINPHIEFQAVSKAVLGYWCDDEEGFRHIILTNGSRQYHVKSIADKDKIIFYQISHPRHDEYTRELRTEQMIKVSDVIETQQDSGLVYYRNVKTDGKVQRQLLLDSTYTVESVVFKYRYKKSEKFNKGVSYLKLDDGFGEFSNDNKTAYIIIPEERKQFCRFKQLTRKSRKKKKG